MHIVSDRDLQFISQVWKAFCSALWASVSLASGYHPQYNGQMERCNQELEVHYKQPLLLEQTPNLDSICTQHRLPLSPFEASLGYSPPVRPSRESEVAVPSVQHYL